MIRTSPGPFTFQKRPSRNTTPRSYSRSTRNDETISMAIARRTTPPNPRPRPMASLLCVVRVGGDDGEHEPLAPGHPHRLARA